MIHLVWNKSFEKKLKNWIEKHPESGSMIQEKLQLFTENPFNPELKNHKLSGKLKDLRSITVGYDCRIIFTFIEKEIALLISIGTHDEVY